MAPASPFVDSEIAQRSRLFASAIGIAVAAFCLLALAGWTLGIDTLKSGIPGLPTIKANTALCLGLLAAAVPLIAGRGGLGARLLILPLAAGAISALSLLQYVLPIDLGLDQLLFADVASPGNPHPGRMAPTSGIAILCLATAIALQGRSRIPDSMRQAAAVFPLMLGLFAATGHFYGFHFLDGHGFGFATTPLPTALAMTLLGVAVLASTPETGIARVVLANRAGGRFARLMLPVAIALPVLVGWFRMLGEDMGLYGPDFGTLLMVVAAILVLSLIATVSAHWINRSEETLLDAQLALERRVHDRTGELESTVARLRAEIALRETAEGKRADTERVLQNAIEFAPIGMALVSPDGRWLRVNRALCDIIGYGEQELLKLTFQDITHPDDLEADLALAGRLMRAEIPSYQIEKRYLTKPGGAVWIMLSASLVRDAQGNPMFFVAQIEDISNRKQAELEHAASRQFLSEVINYIPIPLTVKDDTGRLVIVNSAMGTFHGKPAGELIGKTDHDLFSPERARTFREEDRVILRTGQGFLEEQPFITASGETRWVVKQKDRVVLEDGRRCVITTLLDITQRKEAELASEADRRMLTEIIESLPLPLVVKDDQHRMVIVNEATGRFHGKPREFFLGKTGAEFLPPEQAAQHFAEDDAAMASSDPVVIEQKLQTANGKSHWVLKHKRGVTLPDGRRWLIAVVNDITSRRDAQAALAEREAWLRLITDSSIACIGYIDRGERFRFCNKTYEHWYGLTPERMLGLSIREVVGNDVYPGIEPYYRQALEGQRTHYERQLLHGGRVRHILVDLIPDADNTGLVKGVFTYASDISERKQAELALERSQKFLESVIEAIPQPVFLKDSNHRWVLFNSAFCELLNRDRAALLNRSDPDVFAPDVAKRVWDEDDEVFSGEGSLFVEEVSSIRRDGAVRWLLKSKKRVTMPDQGAYIVGISTDITRLKETQEALHKSNELHRLLAENSSDLISLLTPAGEVDYASPASLPLLERKPEELLGRMVTDLIHPEDAGRAAQIFAEVVKKQAPVVFTCRLLKAGGGFLWIETSFRAIRDPATGRTRQVIGVSRDITQRVQVTEALNHFKYVLDNTLDMIFIYDATTLRFNYVNLGAAQALGFTTEELIGKAPWEVRTDITEAEYHKSIEPFLNGEIQSRKVETSHRRADGTIMPVEVTMQLVRQHGEAGTFISVARDLTERKKIDKLKNEFVSTVSHELRTPVTSIRGSLGLLASGVAGELPDQARQLIGIAHSNSERLIRLISDILDIERIESGKMRFSMRPTGLRALLEDALAANAGYAEQFGVRFVLSGVIPDLAVRIDTDRILQVMANLLSNAAKFSPSGGTIEISVAVASATVRISVTDHGGGIPEEFQGKIFGKFSQADAGDNRKLGGSGLGLSIAKSIVEKHGGSIGFTTRAGVGTTFYFDLPTSFGATLPSDEELQSGEADSIQAKP